MISHRATQNLGLGLLLLILLAVVAVAYQRSQHAVHALQHVVEEHTPLQARLLQVNELLNGADRVFAAYIRRDRVTSDDVLTALRNLADGVSAIDGAVAAENRLFTHDQNPIGGIRLYFLYYLEEELTDPAADTVAASLGEIEARFDALRGRLREVEKYSHGAAQTVDLTARVESAGWALTAAESVLKRYVGRERVELQEVLLPVERSLQLLRAAAVPTDIGAATMTLGNAQRVLERYKIALLRYADSEALAQNSGSGKEIEAEVIQAWGNAEIALGELNRILSNDIREDQEQTIASEQSRQRVMLGLASMGLFLAALVSYLLGRSLSQRLDKLAEGSRRIASGELGHRLDLSADDELGQVAEAFNEMSAELKRKDEELSCSLDQLNEANREISRTNIQLKSRVAQRTNQLRMARVAQRTTQLRMELIAAQSANRLKDEFLAKISHEIRTPLSGMLGTAELLLDTALSGEQRRYTRALQESSLSLLRIINDILDFSSIKAGKLSLQEVDFELVTVVELSLEAVTPAAHDKGLELACDLSPELPRTVRGDPDRVRQILLNLLDNAVKFTDQGEVVLRVMPNVDDGARALRFEVNDTGIGIPEDAKPKLYDSFIQVDDSSTRRHGGTGLGLAIVKQLVDQMGGEVGVSSQPDGGSTFWFSLTLPEAQDCERLGPQADPAFARLQVLIVDDNATSRTLLARTARLLGCNTETVADGETALARLRQAVRAGKPFDIVLVDAVMPVMDGITLVRRIRDDAQIGTPALIVLAQTGVPGDATRRTALGQAVSWLNKPVYARALEDSLRMVTEVSASEPRPVPSGVLREKVSFGGTRVLLAEDNPLIQEVVGDMLKILGCKPDVVADGRAALAALADKRYDLVLMDCQMPVLDGYHVVAALRRREGMARHTPVVALTASALDGTRERCLAAGMDDYLAKPVLKKDLKAVLAQWCRGAGATHDASGRVGGA